MTRPVHFRPGYVAAVWVGGCAGTLARFGIGRLVPPVTGVPVATVAINVAGAFVLGLLLERLARGGADVGRRRVRRLLLGTGVLGGFTTYSALAVDTVTLLEAGRLGSATAYALGTLVVGGLASAAGILVGGRGRAGQP